jgi:hypothetical protein
MHIWKQYQADVYFLMTRGPSCWCGRSCSISHYSSPAIHCLHLFVQRCMKDKVVNVFLASLGLFQSLVSFQHTPLSLTIVMSSHYSHHYPPSSLPCDPVPITPFPCHHLVILSSDTSDSIYKVHRHLLIACCLLNACQHRLSLNGSLFRWEAPLAMPCRLPLKTACPYFWTS